MQLEPRSPSPRRDIEQLTARLETAYGRPPSPVPSDPMEELVSCILSQHTADVNSMPAFQSLRRAFPTWEELADASPESVAHAVRSAGLANQKARSILGCLRAISEQTGHLSLEHLRGLSMLEAREWLMRLPGVGPKTASIVLCFAFELGAIPVDTHVYRVSWRIGLIPKLGESKAHDALLALVPQPLAYRFHVALIRHGRQTCKAPLPLCGQCVVTDLCDWFKSGGPMKTPRVLEPPQI